MSSDPTQAPADEGNDDETSEQTLLDQLRADLDRFRDLAMRSTADLENYRKRASREKEDAVKYANAAFLERLVPILDNFELGMNAAKNETGAAAIVAGLEMVARQLQDFLTACGVEPVDAEPGTVFDPNLHEAIGQQEHAEIADGAIVQQMRKGFKLRDRLLRPATVLVSKGKAG
ncbi:MAG: nucleotide exchange factor GrpE [Chthoniobacteraceae bacterium]